MFTEAEKQALAEGLPIWTAAVWIQNAKQAVTIERSESHISF